MEILSIIRQLIKFRLRDDRLLQKTYEVKSFPNVDDLPEIVLMGLPEGTIVSNSRNVLEMKSQTNASDNDILETIDRHRKRLFSESGPMPSPLTLPNYIKYRLNIEHSHDVPISDKFIHDAIEIANKAYR
jgi:hypothetical protein